MNRKTPFLLGAAATVFAVSVASYSLGTLPGVNVLLTMARTAPSCGQCHGRTPGGNNLHVNVTPSLRSLDLGQAIKLSAGATGGAPSTDAGFVMEATSGQFTAGANSRISAAGNFITHSTGASNRRWNYSYRAGQTPGVVELYTVVNTTNGNGGVTGDDWGFHHADATQGLSTPVRLFVNAKGNQSFGSGCVGSFGNHPVLGASESPAIGNGNYGLEVVGAAPSSSVVVLFGSKLATPINLGLIGVTGCDLLISSFSSLSGSTSAGSAARGDGSVTLPFPIPSTPSLVGVRLDTQAAIVDLGNGRAIPVTMTNGLSLTLF